MNVGVLGGGQLARLLALAGERLGVALTCLDPAADACAAAVARHICAPLDDRDALTELADRCDVITYESENVPEAAVDFLAGRVPVCPGATSLRVSADRLQEKMLLRDLGMATTAFAAVDGEAGLEPALAEVGLPAYLKTRRAGYDGRGQILVHSAAELHAAWRRFGGVASVLERRIGFERELSIIGVRGRDGQVGFYPLSENRHRDGILRLATSRPRDPMQQRAEAMARALMVRLDHVGVLALELFQVGGELLASEFAPRVHNSGHWTLQGAATSQFENHLRAILGLPLGDTGALGVAATVNLIGRMPDPAALLAIPDVYLHAYGKAPRPGRKLGHATVHTREASRCEHLAARVLELAGSAADG